MRVLLSYMNKTDSCYFYKGKPFSGVGFEIDDEKNVTAYEMDEGKIIKPYQSVYQMNGEKLRQVDLTEYVNSDLFDYESGFGLVILQGQKYSGIGFEFEDEFCTVERLVINSVIKREAVWYLNGMRESFDVPNPHIVEHYEWFRGGEIKKIRITAPLGDWSKDNGTIHFREDGTIRFFHACPSFLNCFKEIHELALFFPYTESKDLCKAIWDENTHLAGDGFNDDFINMMIESGDWNHVIELKLLSTNIKSPVFKQLKNIRKLCLDGGNKQIHEAIAQQLKQERPDISIYIDRFRYDTRR